MFVGRVNFVHIAKVQIITLKHAVGNQIMLMKFNKKTNQYTFRPIDHHTTIEIDLITIVGRLYLGEIMMLIILITNRIDPNIILQRGGIGTFDQEKTFNVFIVGNLATLNQSVSDS